MTGRFERRGNFARRKNATRKSDRTRRTAGTSGNAAGENPAPEIADTPPAPEADKQAAKEAEKQAAAQDTGEKDAPAKQRRGRQPTAFNPKVEHQTVKSEKVPQTEKSDKSEKQKRGGRPPKATKNEKSASIGGGSIGGASGQTPAKEDAPPVPAAPEPPRDANRINEKETIVYIDHSELHPFKNHPFQVRDDDAMKTLVTSVKERGVDQPVIVRPREEDGYEIVAGHRRQQASEMAGIKNIPCVVRNMTDDEAILAMTESNFNQRSEILATILDFAAALLLFLRQPPQAVIQVIRNQIWLSGYLCGFPGLVAVGEIRVVIGGAVRTALFIIQIGHKVRVVVNIPNG